MKAVSLSSVPERTSVFRRLRRALLVTYLIFFIPLLAANTWLVPLASDYIAELTYDSFTQDLADRHGGGALTAKSLPLFLNNLADTVRRNPEVAIYLVNQDGMVTSWFPADRPVRRDTIPLREIHNRLGPTLNDRPVFGTDPAEPATRTLYSVAELRIDGKVAYLYATIRNVARDHLATWNGKRLAAQLFWPSIAVLLLVITAVLRSALRRLSRSLSGLINAARAVAKGEYATRVPLTGDDELNYIAFSFNVMASSIIEKELQLVDTEARRRSLAATILHDLRAPLTAMHGFLEILSSGTKSSSGRTPLHSVQRGAERLGAFLQNLDEITGLEVLDEKMQFAEVRVDDLLDQAFVIAERKASERGISLAYVPDPAIGTVQGDAHRLGRVVANLLDNACTYTPSGGRVTLAARRTESNVEVTVQDTGIGIDVEDLPKIFQEFYRTESGAKQSSHGTGLGLAIVKKIVEQHGGNIRAESEKGKGTTFIVSLPQAHLQERSPSALTANGYLRGSSSELTNEPGAVPHFTDQPLVYGGSHRHTLWLVGPIITTLLIVSILQGTDPYVPFLAGLGLIASYLLERRLQKARETVNHPGERKIYTFRRLLALLEGAFIAALGLTLSVPHPTAARLLFSWAYVMVVTIIAGIDPAPRLEKIARVLPLLGVLVGNHYRLDRPILWSVGILPGIASSLMILAIYHTRWGKLADVKDNLIVLTLFGIAGTFSTYLAINGWLYLAYLPEHELKRYAAAELAEKIGQYSRPPYRIRQTADTLRSFSTTYPKFAALIVDDVDRWILAGPDQGLTKLPESVERNYCRPNIVSPGALAVFGHPVPSACVSVPINYFGYQSRLFVSGNSSRYGTIFQTIYEILGTTSALAVVFVLGCLGIALGKVTRRLVAERLRTIASTMEQIHHGDLSRRVSIPGNDELNEIAATLNQMVETLLQKQERVRFADEKRRLMVRGIIDGLQPSNETLLQLLPRLVESDAIAANHHTDEILTTLRHIVGEQTRVVDELFTLTKLEIGELNIELLECSVSELLIELPRSVIAADGVGMSADDSELPVVVADPMLFFRLMTILSQELTKQNGSSPPQILTHPAEGGVTVEISGSEHSTESEWRESSDVEQPAGINAVRYSLTQKLLEAMHSTLVVRVAGGTKVATGFRFTLPFPKGQDPRDSDAAATEVPNREM